MHGLSKVTKALGKPVTAGGCSLTSPWQPCHANSVQRTELNTEPCSNTNTPPCITPEVVSLQQICRPWKTSTLPSQDPPAVKNENVARLIGRKALTQCNLIGLAVSAMCDTGAQISMIDCIWKDKYLPDLDIRPLIEIINDDEELEVYAVNGDLTPFVGWVACQSTSLF